MDEIEAVVYSLCSKLKNRRCRFLGMHFPAEIHSYSVGRMMRSYSSQPLEVPVCA